MTWNYARYIEEVAAKGKQEYALPMYVNCQLPAPGERAGEYPSGGPHPYYLEVYCVTASTIDFYSPDIYRPNFEYWIDRYKFSENAVLCRRRGWKAHLTVPSMLMERPGRLAFLHSESKASRVLRMRAVQDQRLRKYTRCWTA